MTSVTPASEKHQYDIYGLGNALVDKEFLVDDAFLAEAGIEKGMMTLIDEPRALALLALLNQRFGLKKRVSGGSAANTIVAAQYFGSRTFYSCRVANDEAGQFYLHDLQAAGVATNSHTESPQPEHANGVTGRCLVMVTPDAERTMNTFLGITGDLSEREVRLDAIAASKVLYIEGYLVTSDAARAAAIQAKRHARANGVDVAFTFSDPAMVQFFRSGLADIIGEDGVDLLFCNEQEAMTWAGVDSVTAAVVELKKIARRFCITLGAKGALIFDGERELNIAPHAVKPVDSNGAGDMFAGAFLHAYTRGLGCELAGQLASLASARCVTHYGPRLPAAEHQEIREVVIGRQ